MQVKDSVFVEYHSILDGTCSCYDADFQRNVLNYAKDLVEGVEEVLSVVTEDSVEEVILYTADSLYALYKKHELCSHVISAIIKYWVYGEYVNKWALDREILSLEIE